MKIKIFILSLFILAMTSISAQNKCDSITYYSDTIYITQDLDYYIVDTMHWAGETELGFAILDFQFDDTTFINITDYSVSNGVWGPYTFVTVLGYNIQYSMVDIPENTVVQAFRRVSHHSMETVCVKPVTFIVNPKSLAVNNLPDQNKFKIYPNPADSEMNIELEEFKTGLDIKITDLSGRIHLSMENISGQKIKVNTDPLSSGVYHILLSDGEGQFKAQQIIVRP